MGGGSLSPPRRNIFIVGNMGVMICLGQGGLHSLSASSFRSDLAYTLIYWWPTMIIFFFTSSTWAVFMTEL